MTSFAFALQGVGHRRVSFDRVDTGLSGLPGLDRAKRKAWTAFQPAVPAAYCAGTSTSARTSTC